MIFPISTFSTLATIRISGCGLVTENIACERRSSIIIIPLLLSVVLFSGHHHLPPHYFLKPIWHSDNTPKNNHCYHYSTSSVYLTCTLLTLQLQHRVRTLKDQDLFWKTKPVLKVCTEIETVSSSRLQTILISTCWITAS